MSNFKVVVIGGGPTGLIAAHALSQAGIDFVVLEAQPVIAKDVGASLVMMTYSIRVLAQLGLLDALRTYGHEAIHQAEYAGDKLVIESWPGYSMVEDHGQMGMMFHRAELVQLFYDGLSAEDQARIHVGKQLASIDNTDDGVLVTCTDGSTYEGSIVLGADGVHSKVRAILREQMLKDSLESEVDEDRPFPCAYKTLWCSFPRRYEIAPGEHIVTHGNGASLQFLSSSKRSWVFAYEKLEAPTRERVKYTEADMDAFAAKHGELTIGPRLKLKDVVKHRTAGGLTNLEEGVLRNWSHGRIVLAGDSCHKFTPNAGAGLNNGIQDIVALTNELHKLRQLRGPPPSSVELKAAFKRYQDVRAKMVMEDYDLSRHTTRLCAWPNTGYWLFDQYLLPYLPMRDYLIRNYLVVPKFSQALCFDFIEGEEPFEGKVPWAHPIKKKVLS